MQSQTLSMYLFFFITLLSTTVIAIPAIPGFLNVPCTYSTPLKRPKTYNAPALSYCKHANTAFTNCEYWTTAGDQRGVVKLLKLDVCYGVGPIFQGTDPAFSMAHQILSLLCG